MFQLFMKQAGLEAEKMVFSNGIEFSINSDKFNKEKKKKRNRLARAGESNLTCCFEGITMAHTGFTYSQWAFPQTNKNEWRDEYISINSVK